MGNGTDSSPIIWLSDNRAMASAVNVFHHARGSHPARAGVKKEFSSEALAYCMQMLKLLEII
jgi:hypothetical protein